MVYCLRNVFTVLVAILLLCRFTVGAESRHTILWADITSGQTKLRPGVTIAPPDIHATSTAFAGLSDGRSVWYREIGEHFACTFDLPHSAQVASISVTFLTHQGFPCTALQVTVNQRMVAEIQARVAGQMDLHVLQDPAIIAAFQAGRNEICIANKNGPVGIQQIRIEYDQPYPTFGVPGTSIRLRLRAPLPGDSLDGEQGILIEWEAENVPANDIVSICYTRDNDAPMKVPGAVYSPGPTTWHKHRDALVWKAGNVAKESELSFQIVHKPDLGKEIAREPFHLDHDAVPVQFDGEYLLVRGYHLVTRESGWSNSWQVWDLRARRQIWDSTTWDSTTWDSQPLITCDRILTVNERSKPLEPCVVRVQSLISGKVMQQLEYPKDIGLASTIKIIGVSRNDQVLAELGYLDFEAESSGVKLLRWDLSSGKLILCKDLPEDCNVVAYSPAVDQLAAEELKFYLPKASASNQNPQRIPTSNRITLFDARDLHTHCSIDCLAFPSAVNLASFSPDGTKLALQCCYRVGRGKKWTATVVNIPQSRIEWRYDIPVNTEKDVSVFSGFTWSPDSAVLIGYGAEVISDYGQTRRWLSANSLMWNAMTSEYKTALHVPDRPWVRVAFLPDSKQMIVLERTYMEERAGSSVDYKIIDQQLVVRKIPDADEK